MVWLESCLLVHCAIFWHGLIQSLLKLVLFQKIPSISEEFSDLSPSSLLKTLCTPVQRMVCARSVIVDPTRCWGCLHFINIVRSFNKPVAIVLFLHMSAPALRWLSEYSASHIASGRACYPCLLLMSSAQPSNTNITRKITSFVYWNNPHLMNVTHS